MDEAALPDARPTPGDLKVEEVMEMSDPDPLGVQALEKEGIEIVEAGTLRRPSLDEFESRPSPKSPTFNKYKLPPAFTKPPPLPPREGSSGSLEAFPEAVEDESADGMREMVLVEPIPAVTGNKAKIQVDRPETLPVNTEVESTPDVFEDANG